MPTDHMIIRIGSAAVSMIIPILVLIEVRKARRAISRRAYTDLRIDPDQWRHCPIDDDESDSCRPSDPPARLRTTVTINGVTHHLEAWQVIPRSDPQQLLAYPEDLDRLDLISATDGPFATVEIHGHDYVVVVFPYR